jgi:ATP synthase protein I
MKESINPEKDPVSGHDLNLAEVGKYLTLVYQLGFMVIFSLAFFLVFGLFVDRWLGTSGIFMIIGILFGVAGGFYLVYKSIIEMDKL